MIGLRGFARCDTEGCRAEIELEVGFRINSMLYFSPTDLTPPGWTCSTSPAFKLYCPVCSKARAEEKRRNKFKVVPHAGNGGT